jgi:hypothetical protein
MAAALINNLHCVTQAISVHCEERRMVDEEKTSLGEEGRGGKEEEEQADDQ